MLSGMHFVAEAFSHRQRHAEQKKKWRQAQIMTSVRRSLASNRGHFGHKVATLEVDSVSKKVRRNWVSIRPSVGFTHKFTMGVVILNKQRLFVETGLVAGSQTNRSIQLHGHVSQGSRPS
ncbi:hypothetical protein GN244_ATG17409 [Phytophthora infestans]|uniref:Uncharacterized protein n=1 Tax=Phytophthora infestans TaxID=4787 RepID=A0A833S1R7_PHYIN|nr:hypothetical protein GN244_ATG17409 [Phytophthora infestans]KAF4129552.1 hypothetical protein GN958_ATG21259 [Phytophthora infestans]